MIGSRRVSIYRVPILLTVVGAGRRNQCHIIEYTLTESSDFPTAAGHSWWQLIELSAAAQLFTRQEWGYFNKCWVWEDCFTASLFFFVSQKVLSPHLKYYQGCLNCERQVFVSKAKKWSKFLRRQTVAQVDCANNIPLERKKKFGVYESSRKSTRYNTNKIKDVSTTNIVFECV